MKKVLVEVLNTSTGFINHGVIEEPVKKGLEIDNALKHFGVSYGEVEWDINLKRSTLNTTAEIMVGVVPETSKVVTVIAYGE